jgi:hypothetical protein
MEELSKEVYHDVRKMVKRELFGKAKPKPWIVPSITNCEELLGKLIAKTYGKNIVEVAHVKSTDKWFRAIRMRKKIFILMEGRKGEGWWTLTFSHGFNKHSKTHILYTIMRKSKRFANVVKRGSLKKDLEIIEIIGKIWKRHCQGEFYRGKFPKVVTTTLVKREKRKKTAAERFQKSTQYVRRRYEQ